jgi:hypothetical protein
VHLNLLLGELGDEERLEECMDFDVEASPFPCYERTPQARGCDRLRIVQIMAELGMAVNLRQRVVALT